MDSKQFISLICKKLSGDISVVDSQRIEKELEENPDSKKQFEFIKTRWEASGKLRPNQKEALTWAEVEEYIFHKQVPKGRHVRFPRWYYAAASVIMIIGVWFLFKFYQQPKMIIHEALSSAITVTLPDSSKVWLNKGSQLSYSEIYNHGLRELQLNGEGYFEVERNPETPFLVTTGKTQVRVLGTSFNIKTTTDKQRTEVAVVTGKVAFALLSDPDKQVQLLPGDRGIFQNVLGSFSTEKIINPNFLSWQNKTLVFKGADLSAIASDLETYFDIEIEVDKSLQKCQFTMEFEAPSIEDVLEVLFISADIKNEVIKGVYHLSGLGCN